MRKVQRADDVVEVGALSGVYGPGVGPALAGGLDMAVDERSERVSTDAIMGWMGKSRSQWEVPSSAETWRAALLSCAAP